MKTYGLDVQKDTIFCAIYDGKDYTKVNEYDTTIPKIRPMGEYLRREGVTKIAMESTSTYWVPVECCKLCIIGTDSNCFQLAETTVTFVYDNDACCA